MPPTPESTPSATLTSFTMLEPTDILQLIINHRATTCPLDPIPSAVLQSISGDLLPYLSSIINGSLATGIVPPVFKCARVTPLLKKTFLDPSSVKNYRPVSLLATARASSLSSVLILLDLSAAFDTVNHQLLTSSLAELGISGTALSWIASYLADRSYQVAWRGSVSACLAHISSWMARYHLKLNLDKTELLYVHHRTSPLPELSVTIDGTTVTASCSARNLGEVLDDELDFKEQVAATSRSCRFLLYNIRGFDHI